MLQMFNLYDTIIINFLNASILINICLSLKQGLISAKDLPIEFPEVSQEIYIYIYIHI